MNRLLFSLLCVVFVGCATRRATEPAKYQSITPPPVPPGVKAKLKTLSIPPTKTHVVIRWEDCVPQREGAQFRIYETTNFVQWTAIGETSNHFFRVELTRDFAFYGVTAFAVEDGKELETLKNIKTCQEP